jgi:hypothetical protein
VRYAREGATADDWQGLADDAITLLLMITVVPTTTQ